MIDVQRLRMLREVARHGSFSRAAAELLLTPSAVSQQIAALERSLGTTVVERSTRGVSLTEPGRLLVETAETINAELRQVQERIDRLGADRPRLTIATFSTGGRQLLPAALRRFVPAWPQVELSILEAEPELALPLVREGRADLALAYQFDGPLPERTGLTWTPLLADPMSVVLPVGHRLAGRETLDLAELATERWVLGCLRTAEHLHRYAAQAGFELDVLASSTDYFFAQSLVTAGVGISLVPALGLAEDPRLVAVPVADPRPTRYLGVVTAERAGPPQAGAFVAALRATAGNPLASAAPAAHAGSR